MDGIKIRINTFEKASLAFDLSGVVAFGSRILVLMIKQRMKNAYGC